VTAQAKIALMPDWPARMGEDLAALFMGCSTTMFREKVARGVYPQPQREGGRKFWSRRQLERFIDAQFGLPHEGAPGAEDASWDDLR